MQIPCRRHDTFHGVHEPLVPRLPSVRVRDCHLVPGATPEHRLAAEREFARLENLVAPQSL